jgi:hypothetical protein
VLGFAALAVWAIPDLVRGIIDNPTEFACTTSGQGAATMVREIQIAGTSGALAETLAEVGLSVGCRAPSSTRCNAFSKPRTTRVRSGERITTT